MSVCLISEVEFILSPNARLSPVHVSQWESKVAFCLGGLIRLIYCKVTMNTNDLPPSYEDATNSVPPTQTDLAHHYTPPPPFASLPVTAPPVPGIPQPTQPYPTNGTPHTLPTYRRPTVVLQNSLPAHRNQPTNSKRNCCCVISIAFTLIFLKVILIILKYVLRR
ncbi:uncharacterized protein LOC123501906 isoform X1 [Portunus trituberculatus]|uniref:uncharacterized protein LOC123501906 isoform X1 n=1 Tax=Portunus trituberculatus TaxID=210409 RepID=UPI001E1CB7B5|nr:uncharacterized protein LOC123501906 isoform X1 [Portunus trituberculatus]